jgi:benzil reductase ((S)-benzoin forming)
MANERTTVWISGASSGIGAALAADHPWPGARLVNLDIKPAGVAENVLFDLTRPDTWAAVQEHFERALRDPAVERAILLHCAYAPIGKGLVTQVPKADYDRSLVANLAGSLAIAAAFVRNVRPDQEAGLMVMSSGAAAATLLGYSSYGASKAALETWVRVVHAEIAHRGWGPWVVALRPGLVRTATAQAAADLPAELFPLGAAMRRDFDRRGEEAAPVAARIWASLPPAPDVALIDLARRDRPQA